MSFIINLAFIIPFLQKVYKYFKTTRYKRKVLAYNNDPIQIYQSVLNYKVASGNEYDVIMCSPLEEIHNVLCIFDYKLQKFVFANQDDNARNEMCIGGTFYNKRTNSYFVRYFDNFEVYVGRKLEKANLVSQKVVYTDNHFGFKINEELFLETKEGLIDYAFLIKLVPKDFNNENDKVVHILFGGTFTGTIKATEYLKTHCKEIYKKFKNEHYFFAIEVNLTDKSFNEKEGIIDLTDKMFSI